MITSITLENFKSFKMAVLPLGKLTVVVGKNASGKSNLRDAFRFLHGIGQHFSVADILGGKFGANGQLLWDGFRGGGKEIIRKGEDTTSLVVKSHFSNGESVSSQTYLAAVKSHGGSEHFVCEESFKNNDRTLFERRFREKEDDYYTSPNFYSYLLKKHIDEYWYRDSPSKTGKTFSHRGDWALGFVAAGDLLSNSDETGLRTLFQALSRMRFLDLDPSRMKIPTRPGPAVLGIHGENFSSVLMRICSDPELKRVLLSWAQVLVPSEIEDIFFKEDLDGKMVTFIKDKFCDVSMYSASDGTLRFLAIAASLLTAKENQFFFFEEVDNGIHPTRVYLILELMQRLCEEKNLQIVVTTHNQALLSNLEKDVRENAVVVHRSESGRGSGILRLSEIPDFEAIVEEQDLGQMYASGWLEDMAAFSEDDEQ